MTNNPTPEQMTKDRAMDVDEIVRGLSEGERVALRVGFMGEAEPTNSVLLLNRRGLAEVFVKKDVLGLVKYWSWNPTSLGLAVRDRLLEQDHG